MEMHTFILAHPECQINIFQFENSCGCRPTKAELIKLKHVEQFCILQTMDKAGNSSKLYGYKVKRITKSV